MRLQYSVGSATGEPLVADNLACVSMGVAMRGTQTYVHAAKDQRHTAVEKGRGR